MIIINFTIGGGGRGDFMEHPKDKAISLPLKIVSSNKFMPYYHFFSQFRRYFALFFAKISLFISFVIFTAAANIPVFCWFYKFYFYYIGI